MARTIIAASIGYTDENGAAQTLYVATEGFVSTPADTPASTLFEGRLSGDIRYAARVASPFTSRRPVAGVGSLLISNNDGFFDNAVRWIFRDGAVTIKTLLVGGTWAGGTTVTVSLVEKFEFVGLGNIKILLRDSASVLSRALQQDVYSSGDANDELKPYSFGVPLQIAPTVINETTFSYECHESAIAGIIDVKEDGAHLAFTNTTNGFTLAAQPTGRITATPFVSGVLGIESINPNVLDYSDQLMMTATNKLLITGFPAGSPLNREVTATGFESRNSASGGKYYFEMLMDALDATDDTTYMDAPQPWDLAVGIGNSVPVNPAHPAGSDQYSALIRRNSGSTWILYHYANAALIDTLNEPGGNTNPRNQVIGVKVNFDDMEISYQVQGVDVGSVATIVNADSYIPLAGVTWGGGFLVNTGLSLYVASSEFVHSIPTGYLQWASGTGFGFTEFISSITDKVSGLSVDSTSQTTIDNIGYSYSYFVNTAKTAADILFEGCASHGGWYYINRVGSLAFGRLQAPGTVVTEFNDADVIEITGMNKDYAPGLSNRMGALRNWTTLTPGSIDSSLGEAEKAKLTRPYQSEVTNSTAMASTYNHAKGAALLPTYFQLEADATTEIARIVALYATERKFLTVDAAFDITQFASFSLGDTVRININRLLLGGATSAWSDGFSSGFGSFRDNKFLLLGFDVNLISNRITLELWG